MPSYEENIADQAHHDKRTPAEADQQLARAAARGARLDARDGGATLKDPPAQGDAQQSYSGMEHPEVPMPVAEQGWDTVVAEAGYYRYVQSHWRDALEATTAEHRQLSRAADAEVERLDYRIHLLTQERDAWAAQRVAHATAADTLEEVAGGLSQDQEKRASMELAQAEAQRGAPAPSRKQGYR